MAQAVNPLTQTPLTFGTLLAMFLRGEIHTDTHIAIEEDPTRFPDYLCEVEDIYSDMCIGPIGYAAKPTSEDRPPIHLLILRNQK